MGNQFYKLLFLALMVSGTGRDSTAIKGNAIFKHPESACLITGNSDRRIFDTTLFPFKDTLYRLTLHIFNTESDDQDKNNSTVTFKRFKAGKVERIFRDSFYCMNHDIEREDFNNDHIKDILFFYSSGARANPTYHLYLVDTIKHKLIYVKGFEDLPNPGLDSTLNIITSVGLAGNNYYKFYEINSKNRLIDLGHGFEEDGKDTTQIDRAITKILREAQKIICDEPCYF